MRRALVAATILVVATFTGAARAPAITNGTLDGNLHPEAGLSP